MDIGKSRRILVTGLLSAFILGSTAAHAACPTGTYVLDLKAPGAIPIALPAPVITAAFSASTCPAQLRAARVAFNLDTTTCKQVNVVVEYEGKPTGWTVNLGDSPTNDGHAGDGGTTENEAELWILEQGLAVANGNLPAGIDNPLLRQDLALTDGAIKFVVKNQFVSWGQPYGFLQTPTTRKLFAMPDTDGQTAAAEKGSKVYLGLNRVILNGSGRLGCGARRVMITLQ